MANINYSKVHSHRTKNTPQKIKARKDQVENNAGGYVFKLDKFKQLRRFLILGADSGTFYVGQRTHAFANTKCVEACVKENPERVLSEILEVSHNGLAHKQEPSLFALATVIANLPEGATINKEIMNKIVRTGTHHLTLIGFVNDLSKWKRRVKNVMRSWYDRPIDNLTYQMVKYQNRSNWSQADALRLIHVTPKNEEFSTLFKWVTDRESFKDIGITTGIRLLDAYRQIHSGEKMTDKKVAKMVQEYNLTHEMIPTEFKNSPIVYDALVQNMPLTALIRNLGKLTQVGVLTPGNLDLISKIESSFTDVNYLKKARIHPMSILIALKTYASGHGFKGSLSWNPVNRVVDALDEAFYKSFQAVEPTNKRIMLAVDVSGSMWWEQYNIANTNICSGEAAAALALITARTEPNYALYAFSTRLQQFNISPRMRLDGAMRETRKIGMGGTDCAAPMLHALKSKELYDTFIVLTDNETWAGGTHPFQALKQYRDKVNPNAKLIVVGMVSTGFTIADPSDPGMLDVVGFDASVPTLMNSFMKDEF